MRAGLALLLASAGLVVGCNLSGPTALSSGRLAYNEVIQATEMEQLLLNLVRLRYVEPPVFLQIGGVTAQYELKGIMGLSADVPNRQSAAGTVFKPKLEASYAEKPTVSLSPLQGANFAESFYAPIDPRTLLYLGYSGWSLERILMLCVRHLNDLPNQPALRPGSKRTVKDFRRAAHLCGLLQARGQLLVAADLTADKADASGKATVETKFLLSGEGPELAELRELLGLDPGLEVVPLTAQMRSAAPKGLAVGTRSLMRVLSMLARGVEVPAEDRDVVYADVRGDGETFGFQEAIRDMWRIRSDAISGPGPLVEIDYRGHTFWIDDADEETKATFVLLHQLYGIQTGHLAPNLPLITLSAGG
ncbi:MAG TPA: hypothetical protein DEA08_36210 [Planctomycetes bacterium]|nr:hypothetical protein [Planctomycetota bacterium]